MERGGGRQKARLLKKDHMWRLIVYPDTIGPEQLTSFLDYVWLLGREGKSKQL